jgi:hypothetical protein
MSKREILSRLMSREVDSSAFIRYIRGALDLAKLLRTNGLGEQRGTARNAACPLLFLEASDKRRVNDPDLSRRRSHPFRWRGTDQWLKSR